MSDTAECIHQWLLHDLPKDDLVNKSPDGVRTFAPQGSPKNNPKLTRECMNCGHTDEYDYRVCDWRPV